MTDSTHASGPGSTGSIGSGVPGGGMAAVMDRFDSNGRLVFAGSAATVILIVIGAIAGAWSFGGFALIALVAAIVSLGLAYLATTGASSRGWPIPAIDLVLGAAAVMAVLAVLNLIELLADLDQLDDAGGVVGLVLAVVLAVAVAVTLVGAVRSTPGEMAATRGDRGTRLAVGALGLELLAWLVMLTVSVFALGQTASVGITAAVLAVIILVRGAGPGGAWRLPFPAAWIAVVLAVVAALVLLDQFGQVNRMNERVGLEAIDMVAFLAHAIGALGVLAGSVLVAADQARIGAPSAT